MMDIKINTSHSNYNTPLDLEITKSSINDKCHNEVEKWFSANSNKSKTSAILVSLMTDKGVSINKKLQDFEIIKNACHGKYKENFTAKVKNDIEIEIAIKSKKSNFIFSAHLKNQIFKQEIENAAGHKEDFYMADGKVYKIVPRAEHTGIMLIKSNEIYVESKLFDKLNKYSSNVVDMRIVTLKEDVVKNLRQRKPGEVIVEMARVGADIKASSQVAYYDIKLGKHTAISSELQKNHRQSYLKASVKRAKHSFFLDKKSSSHDHCYRLEGQTATSKCDLDRCSTTNIFTNMLLNIPKKHREEFFNDINDALTKRIEFAKSLDLTFVGCSLLFAVPEYPIGDYGKKYTYEKPEIKFIDFAHPIQNPNTAFDKQPMCLIRKKDGLDYEKHKKSFIDGIEKMKEHLHESYAQVTNVTSSKPHKQPLFRANTIR